MSPVIPGTRGRISSLDDLLIYPLCIIGPLGPSKNSNSFTNVLFILCQSLLSLYIHTHKRFDYGFKYLNLRPLISTNTSQYIGTG